MPFGAVSESRLSEVHPLLALRVRQLEQMLSLEGIDIAVVQGLRSWAQQDALYAQGRTLPGKIVTNACGGYSAHNFGYAADLGPDDPSLPGFQIDWNVSHPAWKRMLALAPTVGLAEGAVWRTFPDNPHFYLQELPATPTDEMRQLFKDGGMQSVWAEFLPTKM